MSAADARTRLLSPRTIRGAALLLCAASIVGMIVTSIANRIDAAIAFGFLGAVGALAAGRAEGWGCTSRGNPR